MMDQPCGDAVCAHCHEHHAVPEFTSRPLGGFCSRTCEMEAYLAQFHQDQPGSDGARIPAEAMALSKEERAKVTSAWFHSWETWSRTIEQPTPMPDRPATVSPGKDKIDLLKLRETRKVALFHPKDRPLAGKAPKLLSLLAVTPILLNDKDIDDLKKIRAVAARVTHGLRVVRPDEGEGGAA